MTARERSRAARRANVTRRAATLFLSRLLPYVTRGVGKRVAELEPLELVRAAQLAAKPRGRLSAGEKRRRDDALLAIVGANVVGRTPAVLESLEPWMQTAVTKYLGRYGLTPEGKAVQHA